MRCWSAQATPRGRSRPHRRSSGSWSASCGRLTTHVDEQVGAVGGEARATLGELRGAASTLGGAADQLELLVGDLHEPLDDFASTGLYDFTQLIGETRQLIAALSRVTKEFERDPAGFLIGRSSRGYEAE